MPVETKMTKDQFKRITVIAALGITTVTFLILSMVQCDKKDDAREETKNLAKELDQSQTDLDAAKNKLEKAALRDSLNVLNERNIMWADSVALLNQNLEDCRKGKKVVKKTPAKAPAKTSSNTNSSTSRTSASATSRSETDHGALVVFHDHSQNAEGGIVINVTYDANGNKKVVTSNATPVAAPVKKQPAQVADTLKAGTEKVAVLNNIITKAKGKRKVASTEVTTTEEHTR